MYLTKPIRISLKN